MTGGCPDGSYKAIVTSSSLVYSINIFIQSLYKNKLIMIY